MSLPELEWQIVYGRLAWAVVLVAIMTGLWPAKKSLTRGILSCLLAVAIALLALPGKASLAYWLGLAFQSPSGVLVGLCLIRLHNAWQGKLERPVMVTGLAGFIALAGLVLYIEAMGLLSQGMYYWGFGPAGAPLAASILAVACTAAAIRGFARTHALMLLFAVAVFAVLRLPTGNLWDTLIDPLLWCWAVGWLVRRGWHMQARHHDWRVRQ